MEKNLKLIEEIKGILSLSFDNLISFDDLFAWPVGEKRLIGKTINTKILNDASGKHCRFITEIPPLQEFTLHWHNCKEVCTVLAGKLSDKLNPKLIKKVNDTVIFSEMVKHKPFNPSEKNSLFITVDFYKA